MKKEYLNIELNEAIENYCKKKQLEEQLSNEEWLNLQEQKREARKRYAERFFRTNPNGPED